MLLFINYLILFMRPTVTLLKNIKNRFHDTIHIFKNYFTTIFSVFSFNNNMSVWIKMIVAFSVSCFSFLFFSCAWTVTSHGFTVHALFITVHALFITVHVLKNIKNGSYSTIHTFKNYFASVLSVFSFQFLVSTTISLIQTNPISSIQTDPNIIRLLVLFK